MDMGLENLLSPQHPSASIYWKEKCNEVSEAVQTRGSAPQAADELTLVTTTYCA